MKKPIVYIDMDGVLADFKSALTKISPELIDEFAGQHDNIPGIFSLMEPVPGAIEAVYALKDKYDLYILYLLLRGKIRRLWAINWRG